MACITDDMTLADVAQLPGMRPLADYLMECRPTAREQIYSQPFSLLRSEQGDAIADAVIDGLERLVELTQTDTRTVREIWTAREVDEVPGRSHTKLVFFPGKPYAPFVMVAPGGGYNSVCSYLEGFPTAARLSRAGYNAFVLSYRTREHAAPPAPLEDLAQALRHVLDCAQELCISPSYALMGFSAGAHLAGLMACKSCGWGAFGLLRPKAAILNYPVLDLRTIAVPNAHLFAAEMIDVMFGQQPSQSQLAHWSVVDNAGPGFPPTYLWQCEDDDVAPIKNLELMDARLSELGIPHVAKTFATGGHGLVKPHGADADHWMDGVLSFLNDSLGWSCPQETRG